MAPPLHRRSLIAAALLAALAVPAFAQDPYEAAKREGKLVYYSGQTVPIIQGMIETPYVFRTVERLMIDFWSDVRALRGGR